MNSTPSLFGWNFSAGSWFSTHIRVSYMMPLLAVFMMLRLGASAGLIATVAVVISLVAHEFAHVFAARATGGYGDEIYLSPLGGLAMVHPGGTLLSRVIVPASGPIVNLAICAGLVPIILGQGESVRPLMNPMNYGELSLSESMLAKTCELAFVINWLLVLINLIPVHPLDGGRILQAVLTDRLGTQASNDVYLRVGTIAGFIFAFGGVFLGSAVVTLIGTFVLVMNLEETYRMRTADAYDDSFMGYDFSQGYTSLERDEEFQSEDAPQQKMGRLAKWRQARRERQEALEKQREEEAERELDVILAKLHDVGFDALNETEKRALKRASNRFKNRQDNP